MLTQSCEGRAIAPSPALSKKSCFVSIGTVTSSLVEPGESESSFPELHNGGSSVADSLGMMLGALNFRLISSDARPLNVKELGIALSDAKNGFENSCTRPAEKG